MKQKLAILAIVMILAAPVFSRANHPAAPGQAFLYAYIDPLIVFKGDEQTTLTLEVATTGEGIDSVELSRPIAAAMHDDGTHGDRLAADGIYTLDDIPHSTQYSVLRHGGTHSPSARLRVVIERADKSAEEYSLGIGIVAADQHFLPTRLGDRLYATRYAFFIVDPAGEVLGTADWPLGEIRCGNANFAAFEKLYSVFPDRFDFVVVMPAHAIHDPTRSYAENVPYFIRAKNDIANIGIPIYDNTADFYSAGRLMGIIYHSWGTGQILDHEIGHAWGATLGSAYDLSGCDQCWGSHWNPHSDIGGQMAAYLFHPDAEYGAGHLMDNGDGTWRIEREPGDNQPYSDLDLYAMGLLAPAEVAPIHLLINPDTTDALRVTAERVETYTIDDLMAAEGGERQPSQQASPKQFNIALVVVKNKEFTAAEYAFYSLVARYFASTEPGDLSLTTFHAATGGRARLNPELPSAPPRRPTGRAE